MLITMESLSSVCLSLTHLINSDHFGVKGFFLFGQNIDSKKLNVAKRSDSSAFASTRYHMTENAVDREADSTQVTSDPESSTFSAHHSVLTFLTSAA